jgi:ABC-type methionine transport system ATPase subunit
MAVVDINITAGREAVKEPWVWRLSREFNVKIIILKANVDTDYGWMQLQFEGPVEEIQRATAWLMTTGLHVEAQQRAVGAAPVE